jgi:hypothetical protein
MAEAEKEPIHRTIITTAYSLGKTISTLIIIKILNNQQHNALKEDLNTIQVYATTIVICPSSSIKV